MYSLHQSFNGTLGPALKTDTSKARLAKWALNYAILAKGHAWAIVNLANGDVNEPKLDLNRTVKPMGWGFKADFSDKPGRKATNLTVYVPKTEFRRV